MIHNVPKLNDPSLLKTNVIYVNGEWLTAKSGETFEVHAPECGSEDVELAINAAAAALPAFKNKTGRERAKILRKWYNLVVENSEDIARLITWENGKPLADAMGEASYAASFLEWFSEEAPRVYGDTIPASIPGHRIVTYKEPVGVCALITPWNFPAAMMTRKMAPALAAGCTVVTKSPGETPFTSLAIVELAHRAGVPKGVVNVVSCLKNTSSVGKLLTTSPTIKKVSFTGSTAVGKLLMTQSSSTLKKLSLELGGNAPFIVFDDADIDPAIAGVITSKFRTSGQTCVCANRIYIQAGIYDEFAKKLAAKVNSFVVGGGYTPGVTHGPVIHDRAISKIEAHIRDAQQKGGKVIQGGDRMPELGELFFQPTIITNMTSSMALASEETFGPVAGLFKFESEDEVVKLANMSELGLAGYFYTKDLQRAQRTAEALEVGMVGVNTGIISDVAAPFGGVKESGFGREGSKYGIAEYQVTKMITFGGMNGTLIKSWSEHTLSNGLSEENGSENNQILYMAPPKKTRRANRSLSILSNRSSRVLDSHSDALDQDSADFDNDMEALSWYVIDREIHEWQYVCRTGRPYWWSPESKYRRLKNIPPKLLNEESPRIWMQEVDECPPPSYEKQRKAVSDSCLNDSANVHDLAHLIAVQLLGACFTLPPEHMSGRPGPNHKTFTKQGSPNPTDPRMISSLRLHTHFLYSPRFGHEPRNTSPTRPWSGTYDGPSRLSSPTSVRTKAESSATNTSQYSRHRRPWVLPSYNRLTNNASLEGHTEEHLEACGEKRAIDPSRHIQSGSEENDLGNPSTVTASALPRERNISTAPHDSFSKEQTRVPYSNYRLEPSIRSEPHHVYIQPVKELVVKRWRAIRRRFSGSLHSPLPTGPSTDFRSTTSGSGASEVTSPRMSSDGISRRRRAQERGDIHSRSIDDDPHFSPSVNSHPSPNENPTNNPVMMCSDGDSPRFPLEDPLTAAAYSVAADGHDSSVCYLETTNSPSLSQTQLISSSASNSPHRSDAGFFIQPKSSVPSIPAFCPRRDRARQRRKSTLSEMCIAEDFYPSLKVDTECDTEPVERSVLSAIGSACATPTSVKSDPMLETRQQVQEVSSSFESHEIEGLGSIFSLREESRPRIKRLSTSGTQIFSLLAEGVEVDGLPVGPGKEMWDGPSGRRRARTYL